MKLSILENHLQSSNNAKKNKGKNKNRSNLSHELIHYIADLIGPLYIFHFSFGNTYISDPKIEYN